MLTYVLCMATLLSCSCFHASAPAPTIAQSSHYVGTPTPSAQCIAQHMILQKLHRQGGLFDKLLPIPIANIDPYIGRHRAWFVTAFKFSADSSKVAMKARALDKDEFFVFDIPKEKFLRMDQLLNGQEKNSLLSLTVMSPFSLPSEVSNKHLTVSRPELPEESMRLTKTSVNNYTIELPFFPLCYYSASALSPDSSMLAMASMDTACLYHLPCINPTAAQLKLLIALDQNPDQQSVTFDELAHRCGQSKESVQETFKTFKPLDQQFITQVCNLKDK